MIRFICMGGIVTALICAGVGFAQSSSPKSKSRTGSPGTIPSASGAIHGTNLISVPIFQYKGQPYSGTAIWLHPNGKRSSQAAYVNGLKDGQSIWWDESAQIKESIMFKAGQMDGVRTTWHVNKEKRSETVYKDGKRVTEILLHANGKSQCVTSFKDDKQHGDGKWFYETGEKMAVIRFSAGMKSGPAVGWHENGQKKYDHVWQDDKLISNREWNSDGKEIPAAKNPKK